AERGDRPPHLAHQGGVGEVRVERGRAGGGHLLVGEQFGQLVACPLVVRPGEDRLRQRTPGGETGQDGLLARRGWPLLAAHLVADPECCEVVPQLGGRPGSGEVGLAARDERRRQRPGSRRGLADAGPPGCGYVWSGSQSLITISRARAVASFSRPTRCQYDSPGGGLPASSALIVSISASIRSASSAKNRLRSGMAAYWSGTRSRQWSSSGLA